MIKVILYIVLIGLIVAASYLIYNVYLDIYSPSVKFHINYTELESQPSYNGSLQFYPSMRFNHNRLSYTIGQECQVDKREDMISAFNLLENKTVILSFYESSEGDIAVECSQESIEEGDNLFVGGRGGPESFILNTSYNVISKGNILLYNYQKCALPLVPLHELLHALGFNHSASETSIMNPIASCNQALTNDIILELKRLYSIPALPDLYFYNAEAVKKGNYLNLNFTIRNQGLVDAVNFTVLIFADSKQAYDSGPEDIEMGTGKTFSITNIRIPPSSSVLKLVIEGGPELEDKNNEIILTLA